MQSPRVYFNNIGSICTDSLRHGNGLSALRLLTRAAKSSAAKSSASKTRAMESRLYADRPQCWRIFRSARRETESPVPKDLRVPRHCCSAMI